VKKKLFAYISLAAVYHRIDKYGITEQATQDP
jgi:hypothetical protein